MPARRLRRGAGGVWKGQRLEEHRLGVFDVHAAGGVPASREEEADVRKRAFWSWPMCRRGSLYGEADPNQLLGR